ncbi:tyrosine-type recombinase/integrase [Bradyrhizobium guangdongense]
MARNLLNNADVRAATCPEGKALAKLSDGEGLELWVTPVKREGGDAAITYARRWRFTYTRPVGTVGAGKRNTVSLGTFPPVGLAAARKLADGMRELVAAGKDPSEERQAARKLVDANSYLTTIAQSADAWLADANAHLTMLDRGAGAWLVALRSLPKDANSHLTTFDWVASAWLATVKNPPQKAKRKAAVTVDKLVWLVSLVRPVLGTLQIDAITTPDVGNALAPIVASGRLDSARRCRANLSRIFNSAAKKGLREGDPALPFARDDEELPAPNVEHHAAITDKREGDRDGDAAKRFGALLRACWCYEGSPIVRNALKLIALVACRPGELRALRWSWVHLDSECPRIDFPAGVMKMGEDFEVPLSPQAVAVLTEMQAITGAHELVFPAVAPQRVRKDGAPVKRPAIGARSISEATMNAALRRMDYKNADHVAHGFRTCFSTLANGSKMFDADTIEAAIAHEIPGVRGVYLRSAFTPERRTLAQWWGKNCDDLREERLTGGVDNVVTLPRAVAATGGA